MIELNPVHCCETGISCHLEFAVYTVDSPGAILSKNSQKKLEPMSSSPEKDSSSESEESSSESDDSAPSSKSRSLKGGRIKVYMCIVALKLVPGVHPNVHVEI